MTQYIPITALKNQTDFSKRRNDWDDLSFAKVGVFNPINLNDAMRSIVSHKIPEGHFWEYQQTKVLEDKIVTPVEIKITTKRTGKSQRIKSRKYKVSTSKMSFINHSLERFYERSGRRGYTAKDFYTTKSDDWIDTLTEYQEIQKSKDLLYEKLIVKSNWLLPFGYGVGAGAFLGTVSLRRTSGIERYTVFYEKNRPPLLRYSDYHIRGQKYFIANTFINISQMRTDQRRVYDLVLDGKYHDAFELNFSIKRNEKIKIPIKSRFPIGFTPH